jgi:hypothetical protein
MLIIDGQEAHVRPQTQKKKKNCLAWYVNPQPRICLLANIFTSGKIVEFDPELWILIFQTIEELACS